MKKLLSLIGLAVCPFLGALAQIPPSLLESIVSQIPVSAKVPDSLACDSTALADSLRLSRSVKKLQAISITALRPIYSMDGEVAVYNVAADETARGLTALDALQNAPSVEVDIEGNITLRGSSNVEIWLNGYPTHVDASALKVYLQSLPADAVSRIEVIKNSSAKYMVADGCHIINIVTSARLRNSHFLALGLGGSNEPAVRPWASYVLQNSKFSVNAYLGYSFGNKHSQSQNSSLLRRDDLSSNLDTSVLIHASSESANQKHIWNAFLNLDYKFDSSNSLSLFHFSNLIPTSYTSNSFTDRTDFYPTSRRYTFQNDQTSADLTAIAITNLDWKHKFDNRGHNLSLGLSHTYSYLGGQRDELRRYMPLQGILPPEMADFSKRSAYNNATHNLSFSARYNRPVGLDDELSLRLSVGSQWNNQESVPAFFDSISHQFSVLDSLRFRLMSENAQNAAAGASWRHKWEAATLTLGLRGGLKHSVFSIQGRFPDDSSYSFAYLEPTLDFSYRTPAMHYFRFNYALTTDFPSAVQLSSSRRYGEDDYSVGNPALTPGNTHSFNLSWNKYFKSKGSAEIGSYAKLSTNSICACSDATQDIDPFLGRIVSFSMPYNVGSSYNAGLESNLTYRPVAWFNVRLYANLYRSGYQFLYPRTGLVRSDIISYSLRLNCWANIARRVRVNLSANYGSPTQSLFSQSRNSFRVNLGASSDFCKNRISATVSVSDLFNQNRTQSWNTAPYLLTYSSEHRDSRFLTASLTVRLGKMDLRYKAREGEAN